MGLVSFSWSFPFPACRECGLNADDVVLATGNLASVYGSFIWPATDAPKYITGFAVMVVFMFVAGATAAVIKVVWDDKGLERIDYAAVEREQQREKEEKEGKI